MEKKLYRVADRCGRMCAWGQPSPLPWFVVGIMGLIGCGGTIAGPRNPRGDGGAFSDGGETAGKTDGKAGGSGGTGGKAGGAGGAGKDAGSVTTDGAATPPVSGVTATIAPALVNVAPGATVQFAAMVAGAKTPGVTWAASAGTITASGLFTAPATASTVNITATSTAESRAVGRAYAIVGATTGDEEPLSPVASGSSSVRITTPGWGMNFLAPAHLRLQAVGLDVSNGVATGLPPSISFFIDDKDVGTAADPTNGGQYIVMVEGVAAGKHKIVAITNNKDGSHTTSTPIDITVDDRMDTARPVRVLDKDIVLSGTTNLDLIGSSDKRLLVEGKGFHITSDATWQGSLTVHFADLVGLGSEQVNGIDVTTRGSGVIDIEDSEFDASGSIQVGANDAAPITVARNSFRANSLVSVITDNTKSHPCFVAKGNSSGAKVFKGNRIGLSYAEFDTSGGHWMIGGDTDADSNILIGIRTGVWIAGTNTNAVLRGNYSHDPCGQGFTQCLNFELQESSNILVEHNVIRASAWPLRGLNGEARYNLITDAGHSWVQGPVAGAKIHHNIFLQTVKSLPEQGFNIYTSANNKANDLEIYNNTMDGGGAMIGWNSNVIGISGGALVKTLHSNAFVGFKTPPGWGAIVGGSYGETISAARLGFADFNLFFNPDAGALVRAYGMSVTDKTLGDAGFGKNDLGRTAAPGEDPKFPARPLPFPIRLGDIWSRKVTVSQILSAYRGYYAPGVGSKLTDGGFGGNGNDIGAVGSGAPHPEDLFGKFGGR